MAGAHEGLRDLIRAGVRVGALKAGGAGSRELSPDEQAENDEDRERFVVTEAEVLLHHASETLLRLYLAHVGLPSCPWLEMARERDFRAFKQKVRNLNDELGSDKRRQELTAVFLGHSDREKLQPAPPEDQWNAGAENIEAFLAHFATHFLDAGVYNAAKHGPAVRPGPAAFQVGDDELLQHSGPAIEYLEVRVGDDGGRRWARSTQFVEVERSLAYAFMAARMIKALWTVATARYTSRKVTRLDLLASPRYADAMPSEGISFTNLSIGLLYYDRPGGEGPST